MAKKQTKITKEETLETILFNCRNSLRGRAAMTDKRDLLLTLVFLKFMRLLLNCNCPVPISICRMVYFSLRMKHFGTS